MGQFKIPPISPLLGSTLINFFRILKKGPIAPRYYYKLFFTFLIILIATPFHLWEKLVFRIRLAGLKFEKPPLFILGHWRSGTTLLHTLLCQDPAAAYVTTYQSIFPDNLTSKWVFKTFMRLEMPRRRPSDNMPLDTDLPQEEELAFSNCQPNAYYTFFYFQSRYKILYDQAVHHIGLSDQEIDSWYRTYDHLLKKAYINTAGKRLIIKNPVNTARIKHILRLYPHAKFIFIIRNPVTVYLSSKLFFHKLLPTVTLQKLDKALIDEMVFDTYGRLMNDYLEQKELIPAGHLLEIRYESFERDTIGCIRNIYSQLLNEDFSLIRKPLSEYLSTSGTYVKNKYSIDHTTLEKIAQRLKKFMDIYDYDIPADLIG